MADWVTVSSLATAGGTLVLAIATFGSVRSANRAARVAELSLLAGLRPLLIPSREDDPPQRIGFGDQVIVGVPGHGAAIEVRDGNIYMVIALRNGGAPRLAGRGHQGAAERPEPDQHATDAVTRAVPPSDPRPVHPGWRPWLLA